MAAASGLSLVAARERDAARATSEGTGDVLRAVLDAGIRDIALGIGGSATTDGGAGLLRSLGAEVSDDLATVDLARPRPAPVRDAAADRVRRDQPAARADRRGRDLRPAEGRRRRARSWRSTCAARASRTRSSGRPGRRERDTPGAGAAGGVGFALLALAGQFAELELRPGVELVMEEAGFDAPWPTPTS